MTVTAETADLVKSRSDGVCEICWIDAGQQLSHRRPKGMGGDPRPDTDLPANLMYVSADCHRQIEMFRLWALDNGYLLGQTETPADRPVVWKTDGFMSRQTVLLDNEGGMTPL